jgi:hypothetical protein
MQSELQSFDPFKSFMADSSTFLDRSGIESCWFRFQDSDDVLQLWRLGRDAFHALGKFSDQAEFDNAFSSHRAGIKILVEILQEHGGHLDYINAEGISWKPDFSKCTSMQVLEIFWQANNSFGKGTLPIAGHFLFACLEEIDSALIGLAMDSEHVRSVMAAVTAFANYQAISTGNVALQKARSNLAFHAAKERHARDPKQAEKKFVFECWLDWRQKPSTYKGKAAFARDMLEKCKALESQKVIEDWCRGWENSRSP